MAFIRLFILPHTLAGLFLLLMVPTRLYVYYFGTDVTAIIDRVEQRYSRKTGDFYMLHYHYLLDGRRFDDQRVGGADERVGDQFPGRAAALLGEPTFLSPSLNIKRESLSLAAMALFWNGCLFVFYYYAWIVPIRHRWLMRHGQAAPGVITRRKESGGRGKTFTLYYNSRSTAARSPGKATSARGAINPCPTGRA